MAVPKNKFEIGNTINVGRIPWNKGIGHFDDNPAKLRLAALYVEAHQ